MAARGQTSEIRRRKLLTPIHPKIARDNPEPGTNHTPPKHASPLSPLHLCHVSEEHDSLNPRLRLLVQPLAANYIRHLSRDKQDGQHSENMVSFSCENCGDVLTKKKLDSHRNQCRGASFTCLDCHQYFDGTSYRSHTSCISEDQKYQGALYRPKSKQSLKNGADHSQALVPRKAYVEDDVESGTVAVVDAPPRAPSPPPANFNVFDFLVPDGTSTHHPDEDLSKALPSPDDSRLLEDGRTEDDTWYDVEELPADPMQYDEREDSPIRQYMDTGYSYGSEPLPPGFDRYDSYTHFPPDRVDSAFQTPAPTRKDISARGHVREDSGASLKKSGKRKRGSPEQIDVSLAKALQPTMNGDIVMTDVPALHSGLTGGLQRLMSNRNGFPPSPDFSGEGEGLDGSPLSPLKKPKHVSIDERAPREKEKERGRDPRAKPVLKRKTPAGHVKVAFTVPHAKRERDRDSPVREREREREPEREGEHSRHRRRRRRRSASPDAEHHSSRRELKAIEYKTQTSPVQDPNSSALIRRDPGTVAVRADVSASVRAEMFINFVTKGPDSERGCSINKALKRYHRERMGRTADDDDDDEGPTRGGKRRREEKADEEKELWKSLRLKRNDRGEIVLFF
ncbi:hypothetical protein NA57DRAFT_75800 [Rhizodiscina lignyota]|uniref:Zinc finger C2H2 LYAR-type domain-containing protein n=1 Tax=Rhizodiscina lignyota TaxID=1504668 RepID=A0A9P4M658_9PEZI|nr:hypothetical protein NA57DRAFT_75800 [Rhizodiscina lignyota]